MKKNMNQANSGKSPLNKMREQDALVAAINKSQAVIEFNLDGTIITANENFLKTVGYGLDEIVGKHHRMFVDGDYANSDAYSQFWKKLNNGEYVSGEFKRFGKGMTPVWIVASYNPVMNEEGKPFKVIKFATDVTEEKVELNARIDIMNMTSVVSEADLKGDVIYVNDYLCSLSQYSREECMGKPHNMFRNPDMPKEVFKSMWATIGSGKIFRGRVKNKKKDGTPYYVDAVIAPIMGKNGKPKKYLGVRYDLTEMELERQNMKGIFDAIDASYAYIEFDTSGKVLKANQNFLGTLGYTLDEIVGKHHRIFVETSFSNSPDYVQFWEDLRNGKCVSDSFKRISKSGKEVWIQAVYAPVKDDVGRVCKVIKLATNITNQIEVVGHVVRTANELSNASEQLTSISQQMSGNAEETSAQSTIVSAAAEEVSVNLKSVASASEQLNLSIREIAKNAADSSRVAGQAVRVAENTNSTISKLGESSNEIGNVIKVITSIAQQTNLLALNATIEAARAGEAGKGFAVVANEVKELAKETAKATEDIARKIETIQNDTNSSITAISEISGIINQINEIQSTIASAVEEQSATTNEIEKNVAEASKGSEDIAKNILEVAQAAKDTSKGASNSLMSCNTLSKMANSLQDIVSSLKC